MYKLLIVFALAGVIIAAPSQCEEVDGETGLVRQCFDDLLDSFKGHVNELRGTIDDMRRTFGVLLERRKRCNELPRDDPPTRPQQIAINACEKAWRLNVVAELNRLTVIINQHIVVGRDLVTEFFECSGISLHVDLRVELQREETGDESNIISECFDDLLDSIEAENIDELAGVISDARQTFVYLIERRRRCNELPRDDPPTRLQEIAINACENAWRLSVAIELARITAAINEHVENGRDLIGDFSECSGISLPHP
ncbi:uncharacterized protein LOC131692896 [Topomyia yanbarensis]|uniref:uncharacterized protein LOC131692896 n=1 Tax=Topomyia yanbarensis TaxID=2498891 RepID=UPI00273CC613|nr:uncharacterized protein LOC131692896 [Topomyia yanbarensis]